MNCELLLESLEQFECDTPDVVAGVKVNTLISAVGLKYPWSDAYYVYAREFIYEEAGFKHKVHGDRFGGETENILKDFGSEVEQCSVAFHP